MFLASPMTPHDERLFVAYDEYADLQRQAQSAMSQPSLPYEQKRLAHQRAIDAYKRVSAILSEPTPREMADESAKLTCEGFLLLAVVLGFAGLFLPLVLPTLFGIAVSVAIGAGLGAWAFSFFGRLGQHLGRRM